MAYRALYREWRPKDFSHVVGQNAIISTLRNQVISKRIAHAYLFCGSRGTGKTSTAKILAKAINCLDPVNGDPCGKCENCLRAEREETLDVIEIDAASNNGVDEIRELRDTVKYPPQHGFFKVYIIDEVHMLSSSAFNALLKTLEEPPSHIVFILATTEPQKLPDTILSRCQRFDFGRISVSDICGRLSEAAKGCGANVSNGALMLIARAADGGMRDALSLLDMCLGYSNQVDEELVRKILGTSDSSFLFDFTEAISQRDAGMVFRLVDRLMREGKDPAVFAKDVSRHVRALLIAKVSSDDLAKMMDITDEEASEYIRNSDSITITRLMRILDLFMSLETEMRYSSTPRLALENISIKCCLKTDDPDEQAVNDRIMELEKRVELLEDRIQIIQSSGLPSAAEKTQKETKKQSVPKSTDRTTVSSRVLKSDDTAVWKELMTRIQSLDITAWSFLAQGDLLSCKDGHFTWQPSRKEGEEQYISALNRPDRNKVICECLSEITGRNCTFTAVGHSAESSSCDESEQAYLENIYDTFGQEPVDVVDDMK